MIESIERWPLHPMPYYYETLHRYVRRLAERYGVGYKYFCRRALTMSLKEMQEFESDRTSIDALKRLSNGTSVPIEQLEAMTFAKVWECLIKDLEKMISSEALCNKHKNKLLLPTNL